ncbi:NAD(P)-dependent dehydrogenase (short-subunit alcohol dehydrogenase family) [Deinobacterium chartae]|uniref:NAD(P)-dependent dehydrogenase (Short-subunit alcohol dehydrogenase family) n=1 Tax=Deinobacterium chartae TaxID=521158 RepID=A0A841I0Y6_9DEIO|nr:SDR family oxidoreductase [Deinobacterium chartae]MBB6099337.1 NAD(P)-dependent dehydrogenase (short-subunit alcohol dehydrogenase family) [Deinobacterium chartae]
MEERLHGRKIIVTGAGGALATAVNRALHRAGAELVLVDHGDNARRAVQALGAGVAVTADLGTPEGARVLEAHAEGAYGLVHTVGGFASSPVLEAPPEQLRALFVLNFDTLFHAVRAVVPAMVRAGAGRVIGVSAGQAYRGEGKNAALYTASKSAVAALLRSLDAELAGTGVGAGVLYPMGTIDTPANRAAMPGSDPERWIDPGELARAALFMLSAPEQGRVRELAVHPPR